MTRAEQHNSTPLVHSLYVYLAFVVVTYATEAMNRWKSIYAKMNDVMILGWEIGEDRSGGWSRVTMQVLWGVWLANTYCGRADVDWDQQLRTALVTTLSRRWNAKGDNYDAFMSNLFLCTSVCSHAQDVTARLWRWSSKCIGAHTNARIHFFVPPLSTRLQQFGWNLK